MSKCRPKTGWLSGETYCATHGRAAGWPCSVAAAADELTRMAQEDGLL